MVGGPPCRTRFRRMKWSLSRRQCLQTASRQPLNPHHPLDGVARYYPCLVLCFVHISCTLLGTTNSDYFPLSGEDKVCVVYSLHSGFRSYNIIYKHCYTLFQTTWITFNTDYQIVREFEQNFCNTIANIFKSSSLIIVCINYCY